MAASGEHNDVADLNRGDGQVTSVDALMILQVAAGRHRGRLVLNIIAMLTITAMRRYDPRGRLTRSLLTYQVNLPKHMVR